MRLFLLAALLAFTNTLHLDEENGVIEGENKKTPDTCTGDGDCGDSRYCLVTDEDPDYCYDCCFENG